MPLTSSHLGIGHDCQAFIRLRADFGFPGVAAILFPLGQDKLQVFSLGGDYGTFDDILKFTHVSGPVIILKLIEMRRGQSWQRPIFPLPNHF